MDIEIVAKALKELGHPTRLTIYKRVVRAGYQGIAVGGLQEKLGDPGFNPFTPYFKPGFSWTSYSAP